MEGEMDILLSIVQDLASFGAAGLMGAMWLWERKLTRLREQQLTEAHDRIVRDEQRLSKLTQVVEQNTAAIAHFTDTQRQVVEAMKDLVKELNHAR
jgi:C4-dicarboxylate-specific signal transduction histidine kinase